MVRIRLGRKAVNRTLRYLSITFILSPVNNQKNCGTSWLVGLTEELTEKEVFSKCVHQCLGPVIDRREQKL